MKPCVIVSKFNGMNFIAVDEGGRHCSSYWRSYQGLRETMISYGYTVVSHNSRVGRTILDKMEGKVV